MTNIPQEMLNELAQLKSYCQRSIDRFLAVNERDANNKQSLNLLSLHAFEAAKSVAAAAELTKETLRQCAAVALTHAGSPVTDAAIAAVKAAEIATQAAMKAAAAAAFVAAAEHAEAVSLHAAAEATAATRKAIDAAAEAARLALVAAGTIRRGED